MASHIRRIAVCTGGGDAPGLNAVIRSVVIAAANRGWECYGIRDGFNGIMFPERYPEGGVYRLTRERVRGIGHLGGTILGTTNKGNPLHFPMKMPDGTMRDADRSDEILEFFARKELDALVSIGGDGSLTIANALHQKGLRVVGVPKTIDNDLDKTFTTFGFDTAVAFATECLDRLHSTAESHQRVMVVEVMGRYAGWIALHAGISGSAHAILIPEIPFDIDKVAAKIRARDSEGRMYSLVMVAEGAEPAQESIHRSPSGQHHTGHHCPGPGDDPTTGADSMDDACEALYKCGRRPQPPRLRHQRLPDHRHHGPGRVHGVWMYQRDGKDVLGYFGGTLDGNVLRLTWREPAQAQPGEAQLAGEGWLVFDAGGARFSGRWWTSNRDRQGDWTGWRAPAATTAPALGGAAYGGAAYGNPY